jgi:membrane-associated phospholipid phosphatase
LNDIILGDLGIEIIKTLQGISTELDNVFKLITLTGDTLIYILLIVIIFWTISKRLGIYLAYCLSISGWINGFLKGLFGWERPIINYPTEFRNISSTSGYSFPSGHSQSTGSLWGFLILYYRNSPRLLQYLLPLGIISLILVPISRVYLAVHYPSDVIVGVVLGLIIGILFVAYHQKVEIWVSNLQFIYQVILSFIISICLLLITIGTTILSGHDLHVASLGGMSGVILGLNLGLILESNIIRFDIKPKKNWMYGLRILLGFILISVPYIAVSGIFSSLKDSDLEFIREFIRYAFVAFFGVAVVPWCFKTIENRFT